MIIAIKESKLDKVDSTLFNICSVSKSTFDGASNLDILLPTSDLYVGRMEDTIGKKKFAKKYTKYLSRKNTHQEHMIYSIGTAINNEHHICLVCTDKEYDLGYLEILGEYLSEIYGVQFETGYKEVKEAVEIELDAYTKKERKVLSLPEDELGKKKKKLRHAILKDIDRALGTTMSDEGKDFYEEQKSRYVIDDFALSMLADGVIELNKSGDAIKNVNTSKFDGKSKDLINVILAPKDDEVIGSVVKKVVKGHGIKYKKDALKDLDKDGLVNLIGELYIVLSAYRANPDEEDDD